MHVVAWVALVAWVAWVARASRGCGMYVIKISDVCDFRVELGEHFGPRLVDSQPDVQTAKARFASRCISRGLLRDESHGPLDIGVGGVLRPRHSDSGDDVPSDSQICKAKNTVFIQKTAHQSCGYTDAKKNN